MCQLEENCANIVDVSVPKNRQINRYDVTRLIIYIFFEDKLFDIALGGITCCF